MPQTVILKPEMQVVVNDTLVNYSDTGSGPVLLCVHGWMHDHTTYSQLTQKLGGTYRVIALDLPNFGSSQTSENIQSIAEYAVFLEAFVSKLDIKNYTLVGHSMGCQIGIYGVGAGVLTPKKLMLIAPAGIRNDKAGFKKSLKYASKLVKHIVPKKLKKRFYQAIGSDYDPDMSPLHKSIINKTLSTDIQDEARNINIPTLIINGNVDRQTPLWMAELLNGLINHSTLEIIKNGDHLVHQKHADVIAESVREFAL